MDLEKFIIRFGGISEEYPFYNGEVLLRYYDKEHAYYLVTPDGEEEKQDGVTQTCHIIDKSEALLPWGCKMMANKLMMTIPGTRAAGAIIMTEAELEEWVTKGKSAHKEKLEEAGKVGHTAHNWIETYIKLTIAKDVEGRLTHRANMPVDERAKNGCIAALDWMKRHNVRWHLTERKIYSRKYKFAGTMDGLCTCDSCDNPKCCPVPFKGRLTIADWKTSNYLYLEYLLQTAAYMRAYNEELAYAHLDDVEFSDYATDRWIIRLGKDDGEFEAWHLEAHTFADDFGGFEEALDLTRTVKKLGDRLKERKDDLRAAVKADKLAQKQAKDEAEAIQKAHDKAEKVKLRSEALARACPKSRNYKAKKFPTCTTNDNGPCLACITVWNAKQGKVSSESISLLESILERKSDEQTVRDSATIGQWADYIKSC